MVSRKLLFISILSLLLLAVMACIRHSEVSDTLARAEAVMEEHPDSALYILEAIPDSTLVTSRDSALYALLLTQALIKNRVEFKNDSLILSAIEYFKKHSDKSWLAVAYTYHGRYLVEKGNNDKAMPVVLEGLEIAESVNDTLLMARIHEIIADIYYSSYDVPKELIHRRKAAKLYETTDRKLSYLYSLMEVARSLNDNYREEEAKILLDSIEPLFCEADSFLKLKHKSTYIPYLMDYKDYYTAKNIINECIAYSECIAVDEDIYCSLGKIYVEANQPDSVESVLQEAMNNPDIDRNDAGLQFLELDYLSMTGNYAKAYHKYDSLFQFQNKIVEKVLRDNIETSCSDYYKVKQDEQRQRNEKLKTYILSGILLLTAVSIIVFLIVKLEFRKKDLLRQENLNEIQHLMCKLGEEHSKNSLLTKQSVLVKRLIGNRFVTIDRLCNEYYEKKDSPVLRNSLYKSIEQEIKSFSSKDAMSELEDILNKCHNDVFLKLRSEIHEIKEKDVNFMVFIASGFSPRTICLILGFKLPNYYAKRGKLKSMIEALNFSGKDQLVEWLS